MSRKFVLTAFFITVLIGTLGLSFDVQRVEASGTIYIRADGSIDPSTANIATSDYVTYTFIDNNYDSIVVERSNITIDGNGYLLQGAGGSTSTGISISAVNNVTIENMNIDNFSDGIFGNQTSLSVISGNNVTNNYNGINLYYSSHNSISGNHITNNSGTGIYLYSASNSSISGNHITANNEYGIALSSSVENNTIYHNNFIDNTNQVYVVGFSNVWDNGFEGNYWSDYNGTDANDDGIGDTPYVFDANNRDRYPLMSPWTLLEHELVVSIAAPTYLQLGSSLSLKATVMNQGSNDESNADLTLLINGTIADSATIPLIQAGNSYTLDYLWTPVVKGTYNATVYVHPVPGETSIKNNQITIFVAVSAQPAPPEVAVGVKAGDWIKVDYTVAGAPSGTSLPLWLKVEFLSVEGTNATVCVTMRMSDGTEQNATLSVDVVAGGQAFGLSGFVIPANCTTGDSIYMSGYGNVTIAGEATRSYAGASRTVVYAGFSQYGTQLTYYWDKQTGVIVEASTTSGTMTGTGKATETNMWQAGPSGLPIEPIYLYILVALAIIIVVGAAVFIIRRKKKPPEEVESPQT
jgi:parallel beta-helix repeat protein